MLFTFVLYRFPKPRCVIRTRQTLGFPFKSESEDNGPHFHLVGLMKMNLTSVYARLQGYTYLYQALTKYSPHSVSAVRRLIWPDHLRACCNVSSVSKFMLWMRIRSIIHVTTADIRTHKVFRESQSRVTKPKNPFVVFDRFSQDEVICVERLHEVKLSMWTLHYWPKADSADGMHCLDPACSSHYIHSSHSAATLRIPHTESVWRPSLTVESPPKLWRFCLTHVGDWSQKLSSLVLWPTCFCSTRTMMTGRRFLNSL